MDLPCVPWQDYVAQKWIGLDQDVKESFISLCEIDDVFTCAMNLTTEQDVEAMDNISAGFCGDKNTDQAARCRERGNSSFKSKNYTAAALHYSQGICLAPKSSQQLCLCYANRSAALYYLHHYQESLDDMDRALQSGYPTRLLHKLEDRRASCLTHLSAGLNVTRHSSTSEQLKEVSFGISSQTDVRFSTEKGRHLVATDKIAAGEVILHEKPYSCVLIPTINEEGEFGTEHRRCHRCLRETLCLVPCEGCSYSRYCSTDCMKEAWEEYHCWECPLAANLRVVGVMSQLALRVALKSRLKHISVTKEASTTDPTNTDAEMYHKDSYMNVFHLLHHLNSLSISMRFLCAGTVAILCRKLSWLRLVPASWGPSRTIGTKGEGRTDVETGSTDWSLEMRPLGSAVLRHLLQLRCNAQAIVLLQDTVVAHSSVQSSQEIRIATAIFSTLSLLNHSCCPNTSLVFGTGQTIKEESASNKYGVTVTIRASKTIQSGQEVLHCYGPHSCRMVTQQRQGLLQEQYFFLCQCEACIQQKDNVMEERQLRSDGEGSPKKSGLRCSECKSFLEKCSDSGEYLCVTASCGCCFPVSELSMRLQAIQMDLVKAVDLLEADRPDEALSLLKQVSRQSELTVGETHPLYGELADATARAYATKGEWKKAASHLERSAVVIGSQYGEDSIEMGRQLFKLAQLHFNGGARKAALTIISKAKHLLCLHCGPHSPEVTELQAMEECLRG